MSRWLLLSFAVSVLPYLVGCGSGTYEPKFDQALLKAKSLSAFTTLGRTPLKVADTPVTVRLPKELGGTIFDKNSRSADDPKTLPHPSRLKPAALATLPGWIYTIERRFKDAAEVELPVSCAIFVMDLAELKGKADGKFVRDTILARYPRAKFEKIECPTPDGTNVTWDKLVATGPQEFLVRKNPNEPPGLAMVDGQVQIWMHESPQYLVLLAWRVPNPVAAGFKLDEVAQLAAGTVVIGEKPAPAQKQ